MEINGRDDLLDTGIYSPGMAGALAGVSGKSIGQWARYGLIRPSVFKGRPANLYSYFDVAEAIVVRWMLSHEAITHRDIRLALDGVRSEHPHWPLLNAPLGIGRLSVGDRARLVRQDVPGVFVDATGRSPRSGQIIIKPVLLDRARDMLAHGGWLAAAHNLSRIEVDPLKLGGSPSLRGRRWTVDHVARLAADFEGRQVLQGDYGITPEEVDEALAWMDAVHELAARASPSHSCSMST